MIIFRQKQYDDSPQMDGYKSTIINSGGTNGVGVKTASPTSAQQTTAQNLTAQINNQQELMRQKSLQTMNVNQVRSNRNKGLAERGETKRNMQVASMTQAKKQASIVGVQTAKELERRKSNNYVTPYKSPTKSLSPIATDKRK